MKDFWTMRTSRDGFPSEKNFLLMNNFGQVQEAKGLILRPDKKKTTTNHSIQGDRHLKIMHL